MQIRLRGTSVAARLNVNDNSEFKAGPERIGPEFRVTWSMDLLQLETVVFKTPFQLQTIRQKQPDTHAKPNRDAAALPVFTSRPRDSGIPGI